MLITNKLAFRSRKKATVVIAVILLLCLCFAIRMRTTQELKLSPEGRVRPESTRSPFANTTAFIRYNSEHLERMKTLDRYSAFFHSVHHSMPRMENINKSKAYDQKLTSMSSDNFAHGGVVYNVMADYMQLLWKDHPEVEGVLYFHFDTWIDPSGFANMDYTKLWFVNQTEGPQHMCLIYNEEKMRATDRGYPYDWYGFRRQFQQAALLGLQDLHQDGVYAMNPLELCVGWSDLWYVPRRLFPDFITLSRVFYKYGAFHEIAVATMFNILEKIHDKEPHPEIQFLTDCWGSCCMDNPSIREIDDHRCGHRLNWQNPEASHQFLTKLDRLEMEVYHPH